MIHYYIIMKGNTEFDLGYDRTKINLVEEYIDESVPHTIYRGNLEVIINKELKLNEKVKSRFIKK